MGRHSRSVALHVSGRRSPWVPALVIAVLFLATATAGAETGRISLKVTDNDILVQDAGVSIRTASGESLDLQARTNKVGIAAFTVPAGSYKFYIDHCGDRMWSDVVHTLPNEETRVNLALEQLIKDKTLNPKPVRFDGTPPEKEPVMLASLVDLSGILTQSTVATVNRDKLYWYINDHLGAPMMIVDENQAVIWEGYHEPFGDTAITVNTIENNFRFPGQYFDAESNLHYNYHRYYDPSIGRYLRTDPIGLDGGINIYNYSMSCPINLVDPIGLEVLDPAMIRSIVPNSLSYFSGIKIGGTVFYTDYSTKAYGTLNGIFWNFNEAPPMKLTASSVTVGGGIGFVYKSKEPKWNDFPFGDLTLNIGLGKWFGISYTPITSDIVFNLGLGWPPWPIHVSYPIDQVDCP